MDFSRILRASFRALPAALLLVIVLAGSAGAESPVPAAQSALTAHVLDPDTRIYARRDPFSATLQLNAVGDAYAVRAKAEGWYEVALPDGRTGWIVRQHVVVKPTRAAGSPRAHLGTRREALGALAGTLVGGTVTLACIGGAIVIADPFDGLFVRVHGSGTVSQTTVFLALGAIAASEILTPAAAAFGAYTVGERDQPGGNLLTSWAHATAGGLIGSGLGIGLDALLYQVTGSGIFPFTGLGSLVGTTAGAVIGYQHSKPAHARQYGWIRHVSPPTFGLAQDSSTRGQSYPVVQLNLVELRF
jgi:hypothetical protein